MLEPIKRTRLYEEVVERILNQIKKGTLKPGDRLPTERELAEQLNVSRTSIREALRSMEMMGYIESKVGISGGTFIREVTIDDVIEPFTRLLNSYRKQESILQLTEVRIIFESSTAKLAARRRDEEDLKRIEESLAFMDEEIRGGGIGLEGDNRFHRTVAQATHNDVLVKMANMLEGLLADTRRVTLEKPGIPEESLEDHKAIYEAIRKKGEKQAELTMKTHLGKAHRMASHGEIDFDCVKECGRIKRKDRKFKPCKGQEAPH